MSSWNPRAPENGDSSNCNFFLPQVGYKIALGKFPSALYPVGAPDIRFYEVRSWFHEICVDPCCRRKGYIVHFPSTTCNTWISVMVFLDEKFNSNFKTFPFLSFTSLSLSLSRVDDILPNNNNKNVVSTTAMEINEETLNSLMFPRTHLSPRGITSSYKQTAQGRNYTSYIAREKRRRKQAFPYTANE